MKCHRGDGFLKRDQVSARSRFFDGYNGSESTLYGSLGEDGATPSRRLPSLVSIWSGGALFYLLHLWIYGLLGLFLQAAAVLQQCTVSGCLDC